MGDATTLQLVTSTNRRGAETFATELGVALRGLGREVSTLALTTGGPQSFDHETLADTDPGVLRLAWRARQRLEGVAVVAAHGSRTLPVTALATLAHPVPFVYRNIGDPRYWVADRLRRVRVTAMLRRAARIAVLWPRAAEDIHRLHGIPTERLRIIPNAVPAVRFPAIGEAERARARADFGLAEDTPVVAYVGSLSSEKQPAVAVQAVQAMDGAHLLVAGDGPLRTTLTSAAASTPITFLGQIADPQRVLAAADVLLLTSATEGLPAVLIEAGLRGLPAVATDVGGVSQIIIDQATGLLVQPGDVAQTTAALRRAIDGRADLGPAARAHCLARFTFDTVAPLWDELLTEAVRAG